MNSLKFIEACHDEGLYQGWETFLSVLAKIGQIFNAKFVRMSKEYIYVFSRS